MLRGRGVFERNEQSAGVLDQAEDRQLARLAGQPKHELAGTPVTHRAVLAAGVDQKLGAVGGLNSRRHAEGRIVREVMEPGERSPLLGFDRRLRVRLEQAVATLAEFLEGVWSADAIEVAHPAPPIDEIEKRNRIGHLRGPRELNAKPPNSWGFHQVSQCTIGSSGIRSAGLKSPPVWKPSVISAAWVMRSYGMPSSSAVSFSYLRWNVVQAVTRARSRAASMKLHAAGRMEP